MDAIGLEGIREGVGEGSRALPVKRTTADYGMIKGWLSRCDDLHHITCRLAWSDGLRGIKLINVETHQVVIYPSSSCNYITLSYVWGGVKQCSYKLRDILPAASLPATIEDVMVVMRNLGKWYLWVDSLCIKQDNEEEKLVQISIMSAIYNGAWATLICISGQSAHSGIPRVSTSDGIIPQLTCKIDGRRLLSVMPTLSRQLSQSPWMKHQVYFECNSTQSCESLDSSSSPFHLQSDEQQWSSLDKNLPAYLDNGLDDGIECILGQGVLRDPFRSLSTAHWMPADSINTLMWYMKLVHAYTSKKMTQDSDSIHAFSAVLVHLARTDYKEGFLYGLPMQELPRALLWTHANQLRRRSPFPAWSWAGWEGTVKPILPKGAHSLQLGWEDFPPLRAWKAGADGRPELIYDFDPIRWIEGCESENAVHSDGSGTQESDADTDDDDISNGSSESDWSLNSESEDDQENTSSESSKETDDREVTPWTPKKIDQNRDPVFLIAKDMLERSLTLPVKIDPGVLLVDAIVIRLKFKRNRGQSCADSDSEGLPQDVEENLKANYERCLVEIPGNPKEYELRFYGSNAKRLIDERSGTNQSFVLLARESDGDIWYALLLVDQDGDTASRVAVVSWGINDAALLVDADAQRTLIRLK
ncbi:HET-domain-containing protein [Paxillus ammoniavirescens]|nr:HET-domain-containing protein [Paxillus ammoniavirescens]